VTPNWAPVLAATVAVLGTLGAAIFTQVWTARREDKRRAEDRSEKALATDREDHLRLHQERRTTYVQYLKALHDGSEGVRAVVVGGAPSGGNRVEIAGRAFSDAGVYAAREAVILTSGRDLADAALNAFHRVRDLRDLAAGGFVAEDAGYQNALEAYRKALNRLRAEMRRELGIPTLGDWKEIGPGL
jgi:hypothetical protein